MSSIPDDIYPEILARLPVKSTYRCKCVCKYWFQLISKPSFVKMHLHHAKQKNNTNLLVHTHGYNSCRGKIAIYSINYNSLLLSEIKDDFVEISDTFNLLNCLVELVGSCNGLVCLRNDFSNFVCLWNPAIKKCKKILNSESKYAIEHIRGFGYDHKADDYKVISIMPDVDKPKDSSLVYVYTLRSNLQKRCQIVPYTFSVSKSSGLLVNGALHWYAKTRDEDSRLIISFDISGENFNEVPQTEKILENNKHPARTMGVLDGCLSVVIKNWGEVCFEVWVMRDYGVRESWIKCYIISDKRIMNQNDYLSPVWSFEKRGEILFRWMHASYLELYDPKKQSVRKLSMSGIICLWSAVDYFESLVSVGVGENQET